MVLKTRRFLPPLLVGTVLCVSSVRVAHAGEYTLVPNPQVRSAVTTFNAQTDGFQNNNYPETFFPFDDAGAHELDVQYMWTWHAAFPDEAPPTYVSGVHHYTLGGSLEAHAHGNNATSNIKIYLTAHGDHSQTAYAYTKWNPHYPDDVHDIATPAGADPTEDLGIISNTPQQTLTYTIHLDARGHIEITQAGASHGDAKANSASITSVKIDPLYIHTQNDDGGAPGGGIAGGG